MVSGKTGKICCVPHGEVISTDGEELKKINKWRVLSVAVDRMLFVVYTVVDLLLFLVFIVRPW